MSPPLHTTSLTPPPYYLYFWFKLSLLTTSPPLYIPLYSPLITPSYLLPFVSAYIPTSPYASLSMYVSPSAVTSKSFSKYSPLFLFSFFYLICLHFFLHLRLQVRPCLRLNICLSILFCLCIRLHHHIRIKLTLPCSLYYILNNVICWFVLTYIIHCLFHMIFVHDTILISDTCIWLWWVY